MKIEGVMTALVTPMRGGEVDYDALGARVDAQLDAGIDGLVPVGTTGESATLAVNEHIDVVRYVVGRVKGRVPVIAGAGANATAEAIELSQAAEEVGADGLLHVTPYYNKPSQEGLYQHFAAVAAATKLPIVLYNVPGRTSCDLLADTVIRLSAIDNIVAIKEASANMYRAAQILSRCGSDFSVLSGDDFTAYTLYALGGHGVISVVSNVMPRTMAEMWDAAVAGDWARARARHYEQLPLTELLFAEPSPAPVKEAMALLGWIQPDLRLPLVRCSEELQGRLRALLAEKGLR